MRFANSASVAESRDGDEENQDSSSKRRGSKVPLFTTQLRNQLQEIRKSLMMQKKSVSINLEDNPTPDLNSEDKSINGI